MLSRHLLVGAMVVLLLVFVGISGAQFINVGDPDIRYADMTSGGKPTTLVIGGLTNITTYPFDGSDLKIPFTLNGSGATVWLIIYTTNQHPPLTIEGEGPAPYRDPEHVKAGWHVYDDVDLLVYKSAGERFEEGDNVIVWNGRDMKGNIVRPGTYDLFFAAFDDEGIPHVVGDARPTFGSSGEMFIDTKRGLLFEPSGRVFRMENDWITNPAGWDNIDRSALTAAGAGREGFADNINGAMPLNDEYTEWIGNIFSGGGWLVRYSFDWNTLKILPKEDWALDAGALNGVLHCGDRLPGRQYTCQTDPEQKIVYATGGVSGTVAKITGWSLETGQLVPGRDWDVSDIFLYDNRGSDRVMGVHSLARFPSGKVDPVGITTTCHHSSLVVQFDWDGNVRYMNRNGDYFGDQRDYNKEARTVGDWVYGHTEAPGFKYVVTSTRWGWVSMSQAGLDNVNYGFVLGKDGTGLFSFQPKKIPLSWPQHVAIVDENDGEWDGVYISVGSFGSERAANDWDPTVNPYPLVQLPYDQKKVVLSAGPTAVEEVEAAAPPTKFALDNAYPNPFNPETTIRFSLPWTVQVTVKIFNDQGQFVKELVNDQLGPGEFSVTWDGTDAHGVQVASGVYVYKIEAPNLRMSKKVTLLK